jgi:hypothetical protein
MKIYLATPYSDPDENVKEKRFIAVTRLTGKLMNDGYIVYSPITACHPVSKLCKLPGDWKYWETLDRSFIDWADEIWVLCIEGWSSSVGVAAEIKIAKETGKPVKYIDRKGTIL